MFKDPPPPFYAIFYFALTMSFKQYNVSNIIKQSKEEVLSIIYATYKFCVCIYIKDKVIKSGLIFLLSLHSCNHLRACFFFK